MATTDISGPEVISFRETIFRELGFSRMQAAVLAHCRDDNGWLIDTHHVRKLIAAGCSHELAMRILQ